MGSFLDSTTGSKGFSLLELLVVIAIIGTMAMVAVPSTVGVDQARVDQAASEVAQALRFARDLSIAEADAYAVALDPADERIRVLRVDTSVVPPAPIYDVRHPLTKKLWDIDFDDYSPARGVDLKYTQTFLQACVTAQAPIGFIRGEVVKCQVPISTRPDKITVTLRRGDASATVVLTGLTARVEVP